ncbi:hypothetical protein [Heyndrickxia camelliae]|uniref:Uncharacterized protein n=1 Tax=Heyndrickxia camelliae TaxID=1707093 RepID=A0A2N3LLJ1_9BACI|nr:hypothetical protein [Heyndrickxia camelliae]PKR85498.1 hypothetical protein CWO92_07210 [Heyndrickxia camelliae]
MFDDCSILWYAAGISALRELSETGLDLGNPYVKEFINGYKSETVLNPKWIQILNVETEA